MNSLCGKDDKNWVTRESKSKALTELKLILNPNFTLPKLWVPLLFYPT